MSSPLSPPPPSTFNLPFPVLSFLLPEDWPSFIVLNKFIIMCSVLLTEYTDPLHMPGQKCLLILSKDVSQVARIVPGTLYWERNNLLNEWMVCLNLSVWSVKWGQCSLGFMRIKGDDACKNTQHSAWQKKYSVDEGNYTVVHIHPLSPLIILLTLKNNILRMRKMWSIEIKPVVSLM